MPAPVAQQLALAQVVSPTRAPSSWTRHVGARPAAARRTEGALDRVLAGRTVIAIAHRLHTAARADRVAVMADGEIVELGSPTALLAAGRALRAAGGGGVGLSPAPR